MVIYGQAVFLFIFFHILVSPNNTHTHTHTIYPIHLHSINPILRKKTNIHHTTHIVNLTHAPKINSEWNDWLTDWLLNSLLCVVVFVTCLLERPIVWGGEMEWERRRIFPNVVVIVNIHLSILPYTHYHHHQHSHASTTTTTTTLSSHPLLL